MTITPPNLTYLTYVEALGTAIVQREIKWEGVYWLKPLPLHGCMAAPIGDIPRRPCSA
jgi:hypothetical protein